MNDQERRVVEAMLQAGGSFVQALGKAFLYADNANFVRLRQAFPEYWARYTEVADQWQSQGRF